MKTVEQVCRRVLHLQTLHPEYRNQRLRIARIMDGGLGGARALLGSRKVDDDRLPVANHILSGVEHAAHKLGRLPSLRIEPARDSQTAREHAERRERIIRGYDDFCDFEAQLPQAARWLVGYAFVPWVITVRYDTDGYPYPYAELRDPVDCYPAEWGVDQQPADIAFIRRIPIGELVDLYPQHATALRRRGDGGAVLLGADSPAGGYSDGGAWANSSGNGVDIAEYYDADGCWWVVPEKKLLLEHIPNPLASGPPFHVAKRFSFNRLQGQFDQVVGLMAALAKMNMLGLIATEDSVFSPIIISGEPPAGSLRLGRDAVNVVPNGTQVSRLGSGVNYQLFQEIGHLERQLRQTAQYPVTDDAISPNSFVTGAGLEELTSTSSLLIREYQGIFRRAAQAIDAKRLELDDRAYPNQTKPLAAAVEGAKYAETYTPGKHISRNYRTIREYGLMADMGSPQQIVGGLQLLGAGVIDRTTLLENLDGIPNVTRVQERVRSEQMERTALELLVASAQQGDQAAMRVAIEMMPDGDVKRAMLKWMAPEAEPALTPEEEAALAAQQGQAELPTEPEPVQTVLSRLLGSGQTQGGVQQVATL